MKRVIGLIAAMVLCAGGAAAQEGWPKRVPAPGGEVVLPTEIDEKVYDAVKFAPARRAGDTLYVSGVVAGGPPGEPMDEARFKAALRHAFRRIERTLRASGAGFEDVVMLNTFHVWGGSTYPAAKAEHFAAFAAVKDEFMSAPHPAWTAVGVTELLPDTGVVEIQLIVHVPRAQAQSSKGS